MKNHHEESNEITICSPAMSYLIFWVPRCGRSSRPCRRMSSDAQGSVIIITILYLLTMVKNGNINGGNPKNWFIYG